MFSRTDGRRSGGIDVSSMDVSSDSIDLSPGFSQNDALAGLEIPADHSLFPGGRSGAEVYTDQLSPSHLAAELKFRDESPWTNLASARSSIIPASFQTFPHQYREAAAPSESSTVPPGLLPSDSGYASHRPTRSAAGASVCDESSFDAPVGAVDTLSITSGFNTYLSFQHPSEQIPRNRPSPTNGWPYSHAPSYVKHANQGEGQYVCDKCPKRMKTKSELKKHHQRHDRPFTCDVPGCSRVEGFSTNNDLDRHKRSLHPSEGAKGNFYRCKPDCKSKDKKWPRADNFRCHLKRAHKMESVTDDDLEKYVVRESEVAMAASDLAPDVNRGNTSINLYHDQSMTSEAMESRPALWSTPHNNIIGLTDQVKVSHESKPQSNDQSVSAQGHLHLPSAHGSQLRAMSITAPLSRSQLQGALLKQTEQSPCSCEHGEEIQGSVKPQELTRVSPMSLSSTPPNVGEISSPSTSFADDEVQHRITQSKTDTIEIVDSPSSSKNVELHVKSDDIVTDSKIPSGIFESLLGQNSTLDHDSEEVRKLVKILGDKGILQKHGFQKDEAKTQQDKEPEQKKADDRGCHACSTCHKQFSRRCELKKHEKRHEKPYGCTYLDCGKVFGSKNDWKRHETTQHYLLEIWKCDFTSSSGSCASVRHKRESFKKHLECHSLDPAQVERKLESCHVGRNNEFRYWCGFCVKIIDNLPKGHLACSVRFDHIDDHFTGKNNMPKRDITQWVDIDPNCRGGDKDHDSDDEDVSMGVQKRVRLGKRRTGSSDDGPQRKRHRDDDSAPSDVEYMVEYTCCNCQFVNGGPVVTHCVNCDHLLGPHCRPQ